MSGTGFFGEIAGRYFTAGQLGAIQRAHIGIAGAGGLGSNCAMVLARCGFRRFTIADPDTVEPSNLNRQSYFPRHVGRPKVECLAETMRELNPGCEIDALNIRLDNSNVERCFSRCGVVVEALDTAEGKAMLAAHFARSGKLFVCASGLAGYGDSDRIRTRRVHDTFYVIGDEKSGTGEERRPLAPCVTIAAAKQADVVLGWILEKAAE
jgi:sulfur carrier protein ThiS adenylyltransferase